MACRHVNVSATVFFLALPILAAPPAAAEESAGDPPRRFYESRRIEGDAPTLDGHVGDPAWETVDWSGGFVQRVPAEGEPSQQTEFKVLYDDDAVYFAFRVHDEADEVATLLARRDAFPGDWVEVNIDSYHDRRTAFSFTLSASGVQSDELISRDGERWDPSWDAVWDGATRLDDGGWTAEMRIPLSQLRFSAAEEQVWGLQVNRRVYRLEERSTWQNIPKDRQGWVSNFGELRGLRGLRPRRRIELVPYTVARASSFPAEAGNPFRDGSDSDVDAGIDGKIGITNNMTFDFTVNPDFGQVEADPAQVNLSAFETFFSERRPFFVEGRDIFSVGGLPGGIFFHSRRIGRSPVYTPDVPAGAFVEMPENTTILGAFKLSGKTADGLSVGLLGSVTDEEEASIFRRTEDGTEQRWRETVEPRTGYFLGRLRQDFGGGNTQVGGILSAVHRQLDDGPLAEALREDAFAGGVDFSHYFKDRDYLLEAKVFASEIRGSEAVILDAQTSSARYYQRPDNDHTTLDPTRTSLSGHAGSVALERTSNHELTFRSVVDWRSPGFDTNDLGFLTSTDRIGVDQWIEYSKRNPFSVFNQASLSGGGWAAWDFGGNLLEVGGSFWAEGTFRNRFRLTLSTVVIGRRTSPTELRGGASMRMPGFRQFLVFGSTNQQKKLSASAQVIVGRGDQGSIDRNTVRMSLTWRPNDALRLSLSPSHVDEWREMQYLGTDEYGGSRYLFGSLDQQTTSLTLRLDYSITPRLTVQLYAAPFVYNGRYARFKRVTDPQAASFRDRFALFTDEQLSFDPAAGAFAVDEDVDGRADYSFGQPDSDYRAFNSNLVVRWEYRPGSTLFVVWSQARDESALGSELDYRQELDQLFGAPAHDVFLVKLSRWFSP